MRALRRGFAPRGCCERLASTYALVGILRIEPGTTTLVVNYEETREICQYQNYKHQSEFLLSLSKKRSTKIINLQDL